jgi:hypothetical protein
MAYVIVRIDAPGLTSGALKDKCFETGKAHESVTGLINLLEGINGGAVGAEVRIALRETTIVDGTLASDTNPAAEENFNLK